MDQLQLFELGQGARIEIPLDPQLRKHLITLMAEAIETVFKTKKGVSDEVLAAKDHS